MNIKITQIISDLESIKHRTKNGGEYWMARELMNVLGYTKWGNFETVIQKARSACLNVGEEISNHFLDTGKMVTIGSGANVNINDYYLDRYACYLIAQNGEPSKVEIAAAQTYFAIQTRRQEISDKNKQLLDQRIYLRGRVTKAVKELNNAAKQVGVQKFSVFHDAGYRGLYSMNLTAIKKRKNIGKKRRFV